jgi:adenylate cyclase
MLNSKQLIELTGISRATLNNYVALGILPNPVVKAPSGEEGRATRLGYFEDSAADTIKLVQQMKKDGKSMAQIARELGAGSLISDASASAAASGQAKSVQSSVSGQGSPALAPFSSRRPDSMPSISFDGSIDEFPGPAYMVNNNFEVVWWNDLASDAFTKSSSGLPSDLSSRNLFSLLFASGSSKSEDQLKELLNPYIAASKKRLNHQALMKIYSSLDARQLSIMKELYEDVESVGKEAMIHFPGIIGSDDGQDGPFDLYICFYREGIFFTYHPITLDDNYLLNFLSKRNEVINELLTKRMPYLTDVTVMVADVQNSIKICSELPAEEYFQLINHIWQESAPIFRKYYGTYGKHAGDGMVYYFFPQPDCDYKLNAIQCALELQEMMKSITQQWQSRKGWFSDIFLNIGLNEGQEWFGSYHAGGHVEFTVLGETINYASRISDFACDGAVWATKNMLNQILPEQRSKINFGITRTTRNNENVFVTDTYASVGSLIDSDSTQSDKFKDIDAIPVTEIRDIEKQV